MLNDTNNTSEAVAETTPTETTTEAPTSASRVPDEHQRPCFVVFDDWVEEAGQKYRPGVWLFGIKRGHGDAPPTLNQQWVCSPLHVDAVTTDANDGSYGRLLRFKSARGKWKTWAMPMEMLKGDCAELRGRLLDAGVHIEPRRGVRDQLPVYVQSTTPKRHLQCVLQTGWSDSTHRAFVLPDEVIGPKASSVVYQTEGGNSGEYRTGGTLTGWQTEVAAMAVGNPMLTLAICTAFAGPLLAVVRGDNGGVHFVGPSSIGKTTYLFGACSVWGKPEEYHRTWRSTSNGLEAAANLFNDALLALDEIKQADARDIGEVIYMIGNGAGKQRAGRSGGARALAKWRCSVISTGERSIETSMAMGGERIQAGQTVRLLDMPAQREHGAWDVLHHHPDGRAASNAVKKAAATHYGHAGRAFLECLSHENDALPDALEAVRALPVLAANGEGQIQRAADRFAVLALAGELATAYGVTGWPEGEAIRAVGVCFELWRNQRSASNGANAEHGQVVEAVTAFIERHGDSRFSNADAHDEQRTTLIRERAGYWRDMGGQRVYLFNASGMREALKGFDFERGMSMLQLAGLTPPPGKDGKRGTRLRAQGNQGRFHEIWLDGVPQQGGQSA